MNLGRFRLGFSGLLLPPAANDTAASAALAAATAASAAAAAALDAELVAGEEGHIFPWVAKGKVPIPRWLTLLKY